VKQHTYAHLCFDNLNTALCRYIYALLRYYDFCVAVLFLNNPVVYSYISRVIALLCVQLQQQALSVTYRHWQPTLDLPPPPPPLRHHLWCQLSVLLHPSKLPPLTSLLVRQHFLQCSPSSSPPCYYSHCIKSEAQPRICYKGTTRDILCGTAAGFRTECVLVSKKQNTPIFLWNFSLLGIWPICWSISCLRPWGDMDMHLCLARYVYILGVS